MASNNKEYDSEGDSDSRTGISRRRLLMASGLAALAGCNSTSTSTSTTDNGNNPSKSAETTTKGTSQPKDVGSIPPRHPLLSLAHPSNTFVPKDLNFNWFKSETGVGFVAPLQAVTFGATRAWGMTTNDPALLDAKRVTAKSDGCVKEVELIDGFKWWDGTPVTGEGLALEHEINNYQTFGPDPGDKPSKQIEVDGDGVYRWNYSTPKNDWTIHHGEYDRFNHHPKWYKPWAEKYREASTQDEVDAITAELGQQKITLDQLLDEGLGCGQFKPSDWSETQMTWEKWDGHPMANVTNFEKLKYLIIADETKRVERYKRGDFDILATDVGTVTPEQVEKFELIDEVKANSIINIKFNMDSEFFGDRAIRRAVAYALDFKELQLVLENSGVAAEEMRWQTGTAENVNDHWFGEEWLGDLIDYGQRAQLDKATQVLNDAGYTKQGNVWVNPDGKRMEGINFINLQGFKKLQVVGQYVTSKLGSFGIKMDHTIEAGSNWYTDLTTAKFDCVLNFPDPGAGYGLPPLAYVKENYTGLDQFFELLPSDYKRPSSEDCSVVDIKNVPYTADKGPYYNHPVHAEFPTKVGQTDLSGETQKVMPLEWRWKVDQTSDTDLITEISKKFAWYTNFNLPSITFYNEVFPLIANTTDLVWQDSLPGRRNGVQHSNKVELQILSGRVYSKEKQ